jgi:response regulator RpfG family c-di-GMP phosphodiesterase
VLARYLQSADSRLHAQALRIVDLSEQVASAMRMSRREIDDLRVAAMLMDVENIEITARVIRKAVGQFDEEHISPATIHGTELVHSLRNVLTGASPLLVSNASMETSELPLGARILRTVRSFAELELVAGQEESPTEFALDMLERDERGDSLVIEVLRDVLAEKKSTLAVEARRVVAGQMATSL